MKKIWIRWVGMAVLAFALVYFLGVRCGWWT